MTKDQETWIKSRIQSLRSKQQSVGVFRQTGIQRTIAGLKLQLRSGIWKPHKETSVEVISKKLPAS